VHLEVVPASIQQPAKLDLILLDLKIECSIQSGDTHVDTLATSSLETMQRQVIAGECESYRIPFIKEPFWRPLRLQARGGKEGARRRALSAMLLLQEHRCRDGMQRMAKALLCTTYEKLIHFHPHRS
jgi:hypothetical protein